MTTSSALVENVARWIGQITALANNFPVLKEDGTKKYIRDSDAVRRKPKLANRVLAPTLGKRKLGSVPPNSLQSVLKTPCLSGYDHTGGLKGSPCNNRPKSSQKLRVIGPGGDDLIGTSGHKRRRTSSQDVDDRANASFHAYWRANRDLKDPLAQPSISATDRLKALRERVHANKANCGGEQA